MTKLLNSRHQCNNTTDCWVHPVRQQWYATLVSTAHCVPGTGGFAASQATEDTTLWLDSHTQVALAGVKAAGACYYLPSLCAVLAFDVVRHLHHVTSNQITGFK